MKIDFLTNLKKCFLYLLFVFFISVLSFGQSKTDSSSVSAFLEKIDRKISHRDYAHAKILVKELKSETKLSLQDRFALDLRVAKIQYYADNNEESIQPLLARVAQLHTNPQLQYEYNSFIGQVFKSAKNFEKAVAYYKQALSNADKRSDTLDIIFSCLKIGSCFYRLEYLDMPEYENDIDSALFYYHKALRFPENEKNNRLFSRIYDNLSRIAVSTKNIDTAEAYANKALKINKHIDNSFGVAVSLSNLSTIYYLKKEHKKAIKNAQESNLFIELI